MEVGHPAVIIAVGDASGGQIMAQHVGRVFGQVSPEWLSWGLEIDPGTKGGNHRRGQGLVIVPAALGVGGGHRYGGQVRIQVERFRRQGSQLVGSKPRRGGRTVKPGAVQSGNFVLVSQITRRFANGPAGKFPPVESSMKRC